MDKRKRSVRRVEREYTPPNINEGRVDVVVQRLEENIGEELRTHPERVRRYGINNIFQRTISYLIGWTIENKPTKLQATTAGVLKTAPTATTIEEYVVNPSTPADGWVTVAGAAVKTETFTAVMSIIDVHTKGAAMFVEFSRDGIIYGDKMLVRGNLNTSLSMDLSVKSVRISNVVTTGAADGSYQIVGYR